MQIVQSTKKLYRRLTWSWIPRSDKEAGDAIVKNILLHWFPHKVSKGSISWWYSLWLGTMSFVLFVILTVTGIVLMFLYVPSVERAYASVKDIEYVVSFGWFLRAMHRMSAHLMVATVFLHMVRVFVTGAYKNGRSVGTNRPLNWIIGLALLICTLLLSFTGYLLPWDQLAYWAITVGTNIASAAPIVGEKIRYFLLGGNTIDQGTLIRFYVLHVFFLPVILVSLFAWHMWRIRKDGGLAVVDREALSQKPEQVAPVKSKTYSLLGITNGTTVHVQTRMVNEEENSLPSVPNLSRRIWLVTLVTMLLVMVSSIIVPTPLEAPANPSVTPNPAKAPWYFLWLQEIVTDTTIKLGSFTLNGALVGGILLPGILLVLAIWWPYRDRSSINATGVWFAPERKRQNLIFLALCLFVILLTIVGTFLRGPYWDFYWPWEAWPTTPIRF
ncbi:MAG: DUF4405 domain-containing protein [Ignavibacteria bacterium]|nr:DUF4405 domain-containing protein [Ignavibacteria bacterium]